MLEYNFSDHTWEKADESQGPGRYGVRLVDLRVERKFSAGRQRGELPDL